MNRPPRVPAGTLSRRFRRFAAGLLLSLSGLAWLPSALAQQATVDTQVGDTVTHPVTGVDATVVEILPNYAVLTDNNDVIIIYVEVGQQFVPTGSDTPVTVVAVSTNADTGLIDSITIDPNDPDNPPDPPEDDVMMDVARNVDPDAVDAANDAAGAPGEPGADIPVTVPAGNSNVFNRVRDGGDGDDGNDGYGLEICDPFGLLGCAIIGYGGTNGAPGDDGPTLDYTIGAGNGDIESVSNRLHGIRVISIGGDGGDGGDAYGNFDGRRGGNAGAGGPVEVVSNVDVSTSGSRAHGIYGQSRAGRSGNGGDGYIFGGGGDGGRASEGGTVTLTNNGTINTLGDGSHGIYAQSVGGAAGGGGDSWALVGAGGSSRLGGNGSTATATNNGTIVTEGDSSHGVFAQSVGGTGGDGGSAGGLVVAFGGSGSAGGSGGRAEANTGATSQIVTRGDRSIGVFAQSVGGGGGDGGVGGSIVAFGGSGSAGGSGSTVEITNAAGSTIATNGYAAHAVLAQSVGGGGGNGATAGGVVALGGNGAAAGDGGSVIVASGADIATSGDDARGLFAQSVGGGGGSASGSGGFVSLGGRGGSGGDGGTVALTNTGTVVTEGLGSDAIFAQSVGGGGGSGAASGGVISLGGAGSGGGTGDTVNVINSGILATGNDFARGIFAQSVGGGGGTGGASGGLVSLGGSGAAASNANNVSVVNEGSISTTGVHASAIQAQSVGGGGGDGGTSGGTFLTMGGGGGGGGAAGTVTVESNRNLSTRGADSHGIFAQAIGGGGGNGGNAGSGSAFAGVAIGGAAGGGGDGSAVNVTTNTFEAVVDGNPLTLTPIIATEGDRAKGIFAQSVGGGGGNGGFAVQITGGTFGSVSVGVGGAGGNGGAGSTVDVDATASVTTSGEDADGVIAQSIGGGGGNGGFAISGALQANPAGGVAIAAGFGGTGGNGGDGDEVDANFAGSIRTTGNQSEGFIAQSLGGGGGNGGFSVSGTLSLGGVAAGAVSIGVGGDGGGGGDGRAVRASTDATIATAGDEAGGVLFQSVGGGGGNGGFNVAVALAGGVAGSGAVGVGIGGSGGGGGDGDSVTGGVFGSVTTDGDDSTAVTIQSVGGGGGTGAFNVSVGGSAAGTASGAVSVGVGGSGGGGGDGGAIVANTDAAVTTGGTDSIGLLVQSVGGGGGAGSFNVAGALSGAGTVSVAGGWGVGGSGGDGGDGDTVDATLAGDVATSGDGADGILVQSVGGGGGQGAFSVTGVISGAGTGSIGAGVGFGGSGGGGGESERVTASQDGDVATAGDEATAVTIQSVGGGGGSGGVNVTGAISFAGTGSGGGGIGFGGSGGDGGSASTVDGTVAGDVTTLGRESAAVTIQSVGGGGGTGGVNVAGGFSAAGAGSGAIGVGLGGSGGGGGNGGDVNGNVTGDVTTGGAESSGVLVQSVGGGGGAGGVNVAAAVSASTSGGGAVSFGLGGAGGGGGDGAIVDGSVTGNVTTLGDEASAIVVQSLGGGGGMGGLTVASGLSGGTTGSAALSLGLGGAGGNGGDASIVTAVATGNATTSGDDSAGFLVQSLGGGGGAGGVNVTGAVSLSHGGSGAVGVGIGGAGGGGGDAAAVTATYAGNVATSGDDSVGIFVQSEGGGGGNGGVNVAGALNLSLNGGAGAIGVGGFGGLGGNAADANLVHSGDVTTTGARSDAITIQSLGGGGGRGGVNVSAGIAGTSVGGGGALAFGLGGFGGGGGNAGNVDASVAGNIFATGLEQDFVLLLPEFLVGGELSLDLVPFWRLRSGGSYGVLAQSVGGGGGSGGVNVAGGIALGTPGAAQTFGGAIGIGGFGGGGGDAGAVDLVAGNGHMIVGNGDNMSAIAAQSIGGGGGTGGINVSGGIALDSALAVGVGGPGGDGGAAGNVTVTSNADLMTAGWRAAGLLAQSIGGGGGNGGINVSGGIAPTTAQSVPSVVFGVGGFGGAGDTAGTVSVDHTGNISSEGSEAHGILAQSIGGGGGNGALNVAGNISGASQLALVGGVGGHGGPGTNAGSVTVTSDGSITANGSTAVGLMSPTANGILAQSIGGGGGNGGMNVSGVFVAKGNALALGVGGFGDGGGNASTVDVAHGLRAAESGVIRTLGDQSAGILAQSIGGGGGNAGANLQGILNTTPGSGGSGGTGNDRCAGWDPRLAASTCTNWGNVIAELQGRDGGSSGQTAVAAQIGVGGMGGAAGDAAATTVEHAGTIVTLGEDSTGIVAQSIGGGGGNAAVNLGIGFAKNGIGANIGVGGAPGDGGTGDTVSVIHAGDITTQGDDSAGIHAQSIGGGGGNAALNLVNGYTPKGKIAIGIGRRGGEGGAAGTASIDSNGTITTLGARAVGLYAQSIGNGGGKSGAHSAGGGGPIGGESVSVGLSVGLEGGMGGTADDVDVTARGRVQTQGNESHAIHAQSIGGGGGTGGMATSPVLLSSTVGASFGGVGGEGGTAGDVTVDNFAELLTLGEESNAIFAQSIGGGGGNGGMAIGGGLQTGSGGALLTVGGTGGTGAIAGDVAVTNRGIVDTRGANSNGIFAQSIGGGGGNGGMAINGVVTTGDSGAMNLAIAVGGDGGEGAAAGNTSVINSGLIVTAGSEAHGIFAQSLGGGGGNGGLTGNLLMSGTEGSAQFGITVGGRGGEGGTGGNVAVNNLSEGEDPMSGAILTTGDRAYGIFAQSIGGGGGNGSSVLALNGTRGSGNMQLGLAFGGNGGDGGVAGQVNVTNGGMIETRGSEAHGIVAESIGGGGGHGGLALAVNAVLSADQSSSFSPLFVVGGVGGTGNDADNVSVTNNGSILTSGANADGIVAKSIGGGGGDAGLSLGLNTSSDPATQALTLSGPLLSALGGRGGSGGLGGDVTVVHNGDITLLGAGSQAIDAQSINGGGGGMRLDFSGITGGDENALLDFHLGGDGVSDAGAGTVTVTTNGTINAFADRSIGHGIQAIGGGGGVLEFNLDLADSDTPAAPLPLAMQLGGTNGSGNAGGAINTAHTGDTGSMGQGSHGALLQSIGGGGGRGTMDITLGVNQATDLALTLGGSSGDSEAGGAVNFARDGNVVTFGDLALGTAAQSIGGGGGTLSLNLSAASGDDESPSTGMAKIRAPQQLRSAAMAGNASLTLGATDGSGLDGGSLDLALSGELMTFGSGAHGLLAQSIGGGGGFAQFDGDVDALTVTLGSTGGASGDGGTVAIANSGSIITDGALAHGVLLQSIGGGGGAAFTNAGDGSVDVTLGTSGNGDGGDISFSQNGDIVVYGDGSIAVLAQSLGGGGGLVDDRFFGAAGGTGSGGAITLDLNGSVSAAADNSTAVFAQSTGSDGAGDIAVTLAAGSSMLAGIGGTALSLDGGADNNIRNDGLIMTDDGIDGLAVLATGGDELLQNFGTLAGSIRLGDGRNVLRNELDALFFSGADVDLGNNGTFVSFGNVTPGGAGRISETLVSGDYAQSDDAVLFTDLDLSRRNDGHQTDRLQISGTALLAGTIEVGLWNPGFVMPGDFNDALFSAAGGVGTFDGMASLTEVAGTLGADPTLALTGLPQSAVASFELTLSNGSDLNLSSSINFAPAGLNRSRSSIGQHVNDIQLAGGSWGFAPVASYLFFTPTAEELEDIYDTLSPAPYTDALEHGLLSNSQFGEQLLSCRQQTAAARAQLNGQCRWFRIGRRYHNRDASGDGMSFDQDGVEFSGGMQASLGDGLYFGFGGSFQRSASVSGELANGKSDLAQLGMVVKREIGSVTLAGSLSAGHGWFDTNRLIDRPLPAPALLSAGPGVDVASVHGRLSHRIAGERSWLRSTVDIGINYLHLTSFEENGSTPVALEVPGMSGSFPSVRALLEFGGNFETAGGTHFDPYLRAGVLHFASGKMPAVSARFRAAPDELVPFDIRSAMDRNFGSFAIGLDIHGNSGSSFRLEGTGLAGSDTSTYGIEASWSVGF